MDQGAIEVGTDDASAGSLSNGKSNRWRKRWICELCIIYTLYLKNNFLKVTLRQWKCTIDFNFGAHKY